MGKTSLTSAPSDRRDSSRRRKRASPPDSRPGPPRPDAAGGDPLCPGAGRSPWPQEAPRECPRCPSPVGRAAGFDPGVGVPGSRGCVCWEGRYRGAAEGPPGPSGAQGAPPWTLSGGVRVGEGAGLPASEAEAEAWRTCSRSDSRCASTLARPAIRSGSPADAPAPPSPPLRDAAEAPPPTPASGAAPTPDAGGVAGAPSQVARAGGARSRASRGEPPCSLPDPPGPPSRPPP